MGQVGTCLCHPKNRGCFTHAVMRTARITGAVPVGCYSSKTTFVPPSSVHSHALRCRNPTACGSLCAKGSMLLV